MDQRYLQNRNYKNLLPKFDNIVIVGAMANNILKYKGYNIGASLFEKNSEKIIEEICKNADLIIAAVGKAKIGQK